MARQLGRGETDICGVWGMTAVQEVPGDSDWSMEGGWHEPARTTYVFAFVAIYSVAARMRRRMSVDKHGAHIGGCVYWETGCWLGDRAFRALEITMIWEVKLLQATFAFRWFYPKASLRDAIRSCLVC